MVMTCQRVGCCGQKFVNNFVSATFIQVGLSTNLYQAFYVSKILRVDELTLAGLIWVQKQVHQFKFTVKHQTLQLKFHSL